MRPDMRVARPGRAGITALILVACSTGAGDEPGGAGSSTATRAEARPSPDAEPPRALPADWGEDPRDEPPAPPVPSPLDRVRAAADELLAGDGARRWARAARLGPEQISNEYATMGEGGLEVFSVLDAEGYEGHFKCNILAFELAYRAGLRVPVISRSRGWSYPGPLVLSRMIGAERVVGGWAGVADALDDATLAGLAEEGRVLLAIGVGWRNREGHMGLVEQVHRTGRDNAGRIRLLEYTGWEANRDGAQHRRRTWQLGRFARIRLLELSEPVDAERQVVVVGPPPDEPSLADAARLAPDAVADAALAPRRGEPGPWPSLRSPGDGRMPRLPVVDSLLGGASSFGPFVDVDAVLEAERRDP